MLVDEGGSCPPGLGAHRGRKPSYSAAICPTSAYPDPDSVVEDTTPLNAKSLEPRGSQGLGLERSEELDAGWDEHVVGQEVHANDLARLARELHLDRILRSGHGVLEPRDDAPGLDACRVVVDRQDERVL